MKVETRYWGQIKKAAGCGAETIDVDDRTSLADLVRELASRHGDDFRRLVVDDEGAPRSSLLIVVDDEQVRWDTPPPLRDGVQVSFLSPIAGGCPPAPSSLDTEGS